MSFADYRGRIPNRGPVGVFLWWVCVRTLVRGFMKLVYRQRCTGREHVPRRGPVIYVSNHQSHYDPPIVGCLVGPFHSLARASLFDSRLLAWIIRGIGAIPLRQSGSPASALRAGIDALNAGGRLLLFPEGSRTPDGAVHPFHGGLLVLLRRTKATVVPVALEGAYDVWPRSRKFPRLTGRIATKAGAPIPAGTLLAMEPEAALEHLRTIIDGMRLELRRDLRARTKGRYPAPGPGDAAAA